MTHNCPPMIPAAAARALERTQTLIEQFGGRLAGSDACHSTAQSLRAAFETHCGRASLEAFTTHPSTFTQFYRIDVVLYLAGLALLFLRQPLLAGLLLFSMFAAASLQFGWYVELYDRFYPLATCHNLTAVLEPRGEARQQLILSGHHDSANELRFLQHNQKLYGLKIVIPDFFRVLAMTFAWVWAGWRWAIGGDPAFTPWVLGLLVVGIYFVFTKFFLFEPWAVPGAGDNLIASSLLVELAGMLRDPQRPGGSLLEHTRLVFVSFDAEEAGLRGSRAWVRAHRDELASLPAYALNIDSIYQVSEIQFLSSDLNSHIRLDAEMVKRCLAVAQGCGFPARTAVMRFAGGGTDAAELAKAGVHATTLIAMPSGVVRDGLVYHTMRDTVDAIEPAAVEACLKIGLALAKEIDGEA